MEESEKKGDIQQFLKKNWVWITLIIILGLGVYLRVYHLDYPVLGYHNQKEAHSLTEIRNFYENGISLVNERDYYKPTFDAPYGKHVDNFPLFAWIIVIFWKLLGISLWSARLISVLFSLGAVLFTYLFVKKAFKRKDLALTSTLFAAIMPLWVFFGRQVQYDIIALFFMTASIYFYWCWIEKPAAKNIILTSAFFILAGLSKYPFMIIALPMLLTFPFQRILNKEKFKRFKKQYLFACLTAIPLIFWWFFSKTINVGEKISNVAAFDLERAKIFFTKGMWKGIYVFAVTDNYSFLFFMFALIGFIFALIKIKKRNYKFLAVWGLSYLIYALSAPPQMQGHNYYQIPYAPLIAILCAYSVLLIANSISAFVKQKKMRSALKFTLIAIIFLIMLPQIRLSITRQFDTQFYGLDVAGEYIKNNSAPDEWVMGSGHQDTGIIWHADRKMLDLVSENV